MKSINLLIFSTLLVCLSIVSCVPDNKTAVTDINLSVSDPETQKILDLQDRQDIKALYKYFHHENPTYRYHAVLAFASIKNVDAIDSLATMLKDPVLQVRAVAAYSLGQIGDTKVTDKLINAFSGKDTLDVNNIFNANILEAVGKIGNVADLKAIATVRTYRSTDTLLLLGQARAIFQRALRNITSDDGTSRMIDLLYTDAIPQNVKVLAAQYFARANDLNLSLQAFCAHQSDQQVYRQSLAGGPARPITPAFGAAASPTVSPDGCWVIYVHTYQDVDCLAIVDAEGAHWPQRLALGRDFSDVSPMRGVIHGGARHTLTVAVTVQPMNEPAPPHEDVGEQAADGEPAPPPTH